MCLCKKELDGGLEIGQGFGESFSRTLDSSFGGSNGSHGRAVGETFQFCASTDAAWWMGRMGTREQRTEDRLHDVLAIAAVPQSRMAKESNARVRLSHGELHEDRSNNSTFPEPISDFRQTSCLHLCWCISLPRCGILRAAVCSDQVFVLLPQILNPWTEMNI